MPISPLVCNLSRSKRVVKCSSQSRKQEAWEYGKLDLVYCKAPQYGVIHIFLFEIRALLGDCRDRRQKMQGVGVWSQRPVSSLFCQQSSPSLVLTPPPKNGWCFYVASCAYNSPHFQPQTVFCWIPQWHLAFAQTPQTLAHYSLHEIFLARPTIFLKFSGGHFVWNRSLIKYPIKARRGDTYLWGMPIW